MAEVNERDDLTLKIQYAVGNDEDNPQKIMRTYNGLSSKATFDSLKKVRNAIVSLSNNRLIYSEKVTYQSF